MSQPGSKISVGLSHRELPNKAYISTRTFDTVNAGSGGATSGSGTLYLYTTSLNAQYQTVGALNKNALATTTNCPAGRVVHANGKVLIPGVNPGGGSGVNPSTGGGSSTPNPLPFPMIGVYDPVSGLNGYINPQDSTWAAYDASLSAFYDDGRSNPATLLGGQGAEPRMAPTVNATSSGTTVAGVANIGAGHAGVITIGAATAPTVITVTATDSTPSSVILLTLQSTAGTQQLRITDQSVVGTFVITPSAALAAGDTIRYLIIN
jgi:hypothetical protein